MINECKFQSRRQPVCKVKKAGGGQGGFLDLTDAHDDQVVSGLFIQTSKLQLIHTGKLIKGVCRGKHDRAAM